MIYICCHWDVVVCAYVQVVTFPRCTMAVFHRNALLAVRHFSTSALSQQLVKPPIAVFGVEGRYANALYSAASKQKGLEKVEKDLLKFESAINADKTLAEFLNNPLIKKALKKQAIEEGLKKLNYSPLTVNMLGAMAENGRMRHTNEVIAAFSKIMSAERGEILCEVTTAKPLDDASEKDLQAALSAFTKKGEKILLTKKVDPSILGGMLVSIGDKYVDMSIASKIKLYTSLIKEAV
ncbi:ATP synthase subunit O [Tropilaelaps mercedesae]|uniref:Oligomycin sensitivity conferral protein n=1 Tax=Tropilaelaps mercedesae TaxID=418985 RepID=A0A1V9Y0H9_9ACAR|nr:ATP synthase subunit O [Tropilaelaps mercedesae]